MILIRSNKMVEATTQHLEIIDDHFPICDLAFYPPSTHPVTRNTSPVRISHSNLEGINEGDLFMDLPSLVAVVNERYNRKLTGEIKRFNVDTFNRHQPHEVVEMYEYLEATLGYYRKL